MTEEICDSKTFSIALAVVEVKPRVEIIESPTSLKEKEAIDCTFRVWNDGRDAIEITSTAIYDDETGVLLEKDDAVFWKPNIEPGHYVERELSTWGWSPDMPNRAIKVRVTACTREKGWL